MYNILQAYNQMGILTALETSRMQLNLQLVSLHS